MLVCICNHFRSASTTDRASIAAYTDQLCTIPSTSGNSLVDLAATDPNTPTYWWSNSTLTNGTSALVDGAKRDKLIWPGDYGISVPGVFLSTNDAVTIKLSLEQLFADQNTTTGQLPYFAQPVLTIPESDFLTFGKTAWSFTYHLYSILGLNNYFIYSNDLPYLQQNWNRVVLALNYSLSTIDSTGLANVTSPNDWLRVGMGGHNIEANSILAYTLDTAISLAHTLNETSLVETWSDASTAIKSAANTLLWDATAGLYKDNETTTLHPQDGNVWAIISGVASPATASTISTNLAARWGPYGAPAPEAGTTVSPFISGFELQAHFLAGSPQRAIDLMRFMWADFMLDDPRMTNSTFNEGYSSDGALHYPAYSDDPRISHAHGWSTGPIIALTNYVAGLHVLNGSAWVVHPQVGNLTEVEAGFEIEGGAYSLNYTKAGDGVGFSFGFSTPEGTEGEVVVDVPACDASVKVSSSGGKGGKGKTHWSERVSGWKGGARSAGCSYWGPQGDESSAANGTVTIGGLKGGAYLVELKCV